jgi:serine/threonine-protein kinase RsbW
MTRLGDTCRVQIPPTDRQDVAGRGAVLRMVTIRHAPASAGEVRRQLGAELADAGLPRAVIGDAALVLSELVGNAIRYGRPLPGGVLEVSWTLDEDCLLLRVSDGGGPSVPVRHQAGPEDVRGRGLTIVAALARNWGVEQTSNGAGPTSTVWVELPRR